MNDDACAELETRLRTELGERSDWWLLSGGQIFPNDEGHAIIRWTFDHGTYDVWLVEDEELWCIRLPNGHVTCTPRLLLQPTLWRFILHYDAINQRIQNGRYRLNGYGYP